MMRAPYVKPTPEGTAALIMSDAKRAGYGAVTPSPAAFATSAFLPALQSLLRGLPASQDGVS